MRKVVSVPRGSTMTLGTVEGDLYLSEGATVKAEGLAEKVSVSGLVRCDGDCTFECGLTADSLRGKRGTVTVRGDLSITRSIRIDRGHLVVEGDVSADTIEVDRSASVGKNLTAKNVQVGGKLKVEGNTKAEEQMWGGPFNLVGT